MSEFKTRENPSPEAKAQYVSIPLFGKLKTDASNRFHFDVHDLDHVQRRLKQRHVQM